MYFEVPVFCGVVCATSLVREMLGQKSGVVYVTQDQIYTLLNGVHNLFDLSSKKKRTTTEDASKSVQQHDSEGELTVILNTKDVQKQICDAIIEKVSAPCEDPSSLRDDAFLYGRPSDEDLSTYHGVFVRRLTRDVRMVLCDVQVLAVRPKTHTVSLLL